MGPTTPNKNEQYNLPREGTEFTDGDGMDFHTATVTTTLSAVEALRVAQEYATSSTAEVPAEPEMDQFDRVHLLTDNVVHTRQEVLKAV